MTPDDIFNLERYFKTMLDYVSDPRTDLESWRNDFKWNLQTLNTLITEILAKGPMSEADIQRMARVRELMLSGGRSGIKG